MDTPNLLGAIQGHENNTEQYAAPDENSHKTTVNYSHHDEPLPQTTDVMTNPQ